ncbi:GGDEF domain-containing protein [Mesorhizobium sp. 1M-11]|uniref:GGDEF domain-containing protein n=1 Tax=Mesorhizobium sp. 1M-11 TaxID=1529006 RepID=UPI0006C756E3|nr:GGDEF domain-containing protein [Mesorhizobium sp. 1M-11]
MSDPAKVLGSGLAEHAARLFDWFSTPLENEPKAVRSRFLETTYDRKFAILFASLSVLVLAATAIVLTGAWWPLLWVAADLALLVLRFTLIVRCEAARLHGETPPLGALMIAGGAWSAVFGLGCFGCIASENLVLSVLAGLNVAGVVGVVSSRNAATPRYAILVMLLVSLPFMLGALLSPQSGMWVIGLQMPFYVAGIIGVLVHNHKISVRMIRAELDNRDLAVRDALTGLPNRILLQEELRRMCGQLATPAANGGKPFVVLSMDLDGFKYINDSHGHTAGDRLLRLVGERLRKTFRATDMVFRIGGDEFIVLLPGTSEIEAAHLAKRAIETVSEAFDIEVGTPAYIGLSAGSARAPVDGDTPEQLLTCSDLALYEAKRAGKGRHRAHLPSAG